MEDENDEAEDVKVWSWQRALRPGRFALFYDDEGETPFYAHVVDRDPDPEYVVCDVYSETRPLSPSRHAVHRSRFVFDMSRAQFVAALASGCPSHPRRVQRLVNLTRGGTA